MINIRIENIDDDIWWEDEVLYLRGEDGEIYGLHGFYISSISYGLDESGPATLIGNNKIWT